MAHAVLSPDTNPGRTNNAIEVSKTWDLSANPNEIARSDYCQALSQFFGPAPHNTKTNPEARRPHEAYFLPDAFTGRCDFLSNTIVDVVIAQNSFMTRKVLPLQHREDPTLRWSSFSFDRTLADYEPEQGVPRYVTLKSSSREDYMQRRGLAFYMNHGFANTDMGRMDFKMKIAAIVNAIKETLDQEALLALLNAKNIYKCEQNNRGRSMATIEARTALARDRWATVQKEERGWLMLDADMSDSMIRQGVHADTWIVPPRMAMYATIAQPAETEYYRAGPDARKNLMENGAEKSYTRWRGSTLYEIKPYHMDNDDVDICHLERERFIGDYFVIRDFAFGRYEKKPNNQYQEQVNKQKDVTDVYCCESDKFETFRLHTALEATGVFKKEADGVWGYTKAFRDWFHVGQDGAPAFKDIFDKQYTMQDLVDKSTGKFTDAGKKFCMPCMHWNAKSGLCLIKLNDDPEHHMIKAGWIHPDEATAAMSPAMLGPAMAVGGPQVFFTRYLENLLSLENEFLRTCREAVDEETIVAETNKIENTLKQETSTIQAYVALKLNFCSSAVKTLHNFFKVPQYAPLTEDGAGPADQRSIQEINSCLGGLLLIANENIANGTIVIPEDRVSVAESAKWLRVLVNDQSTKQQHSNLTGLAQKLHRYTTADADAKKAATVTVALALASQHGTTKLAHQSATKIDHQFAAAKAAVMFVEEKANASQLIVADEHAYKNAVSELYAVLDEVATYERPSSVGAPTEDKKTKELCEFFQAFRRGSKAKLLGSPEHIEMINSHTCTDFGGASLPAEKVTPLKATSITQKHDLVHFMISGHLVLQDLFEKSSLNDADNPSIIAAQWALPLVGVDSMFKPLYRKTYDLASQVFYDSGENVTPSWPPCAALSVDETALGRNVLTQETYSAMDMLGLQPLRSYPLWHGLQSSTDTKYASIKALNQDDIHRLFYSIVIDGSYAKLLHALSTGQKDTNILVASVYDTHGGHHRGVSKKVPDLFSVLCSRPFRSYTMGSAIKCKAGGDLGITAHGYEDMQMSDDIISHVHVGHFTIWAAAVVLNEKLLCVAEDIFCSGYNGGENNTFINHASWETEKGYYDPYRYVLHNQASKGSIIAYLMPPHFDNSASETFGWNRAKNPIDITGCCVGMNTDQHNPTEQESRFPCAVANAHWWCMHELKEIVPSAEACDRYAEKYYAPETVVNTTCFQTMQTVVGGNSLGGDLHRGAAIWNTDHWGRDGVYAGVKGVRTGKLAHFKPQGYEGRFVSL